MSHFLTLAGWDLCSGVTWGGGGDRVPPDIFHWEIFTDLLGKEGQGRKGKWRGKEGKFEREKF